MVFLIPEVFGLKHLVGVLVIMVLVGALLYVTLKLNLKRLRIMQISTVLIISLELMKYLYVARAYGYLPASMFPLTLCSYSLYAMPIVTFTKGKVQKLFYPFAYAIGMVSALLVFLYPITVLGTANFWFPVEGDLLPFHSFIYHGVMLYFALFIVLSKMYRPVFKDLVPAFLMLLVAAAVSGLTNLYLGTNFMYLRSGEGSPLGFIFENHGFIVYLFTQVVIALVILSIVFSPFLKAPSGVADQM